MPETKSSPQPFFISATFGEAWNLFKEKWLIVYGLMLLPLVAVIASAILGDILPESLVWLVALIMMVFQMILSMGASKALIELVRGHEISLDLIFSTSNLIFKYIGGCLLYLLIVLGGTLLLVFPGIYWALKYMYMPMLIIDKGLGIGEAKDMSAKMTDGIKWDMVGMMYASIIFGYLGILALVVGLLATVPTVMLAQVIFYNKLLARVEQAELTKKTE